MEINDKIFGFAYMMAFRDATMRNAFPRSRCADSENIKSIESNQLDEVFHKKKKLIKDYSESIVRDYIDDILSGKNPDTLAVIKSLCSEENAEVITSNGFTFGNAQKLVNMTAKYMFLSVYNDPKIRKNYVSCHCPMDSVMMVRIRENNRKYGLGNIKWKYSWSRLGIEDESVKEYERFQEYIRKIAEKEGILPIEVDFLLWDD